MKCENCGQEFGDIVYPLFITKSILTRSNRVIGVQAIQKTTFDGDRLDWDLDYDTEDQDESDFIEESFECSYCGTNLTEDVVLKIVGETWKTKLPKH